MTANPEYAEAPLNPPEPEEEEEEYPNPDDEREDKILND